MIASFIGDVDIVEMLLAAGANPEYTNDAGESALSLAQTKDVERLLRRAIVVLKFSASRKKETEDITPAVEEVSADVEEVPADIEEALTHLEPVVQPPQINLDSTQLNLDSTQPIPDLSEEIPEYQSKPMLQNLDSTQQIVGLDSTQPIPIEFEELKIVAEEEEEEESFAELEADPEEDPLAAEIDQFIQTELQDVQPVIRVERSNRYDAPTLDPIEESFVDHPDEEQASEEIDGFIQTELQDIQPPVYFEAHHDAPSLTMDPMEFLMEPPAVSNETEEDEFSQDELFDVQPSVRFEAKLDEPSLTLDPMEELLMRPPIVEESHDEYLEAELHATENYHQGPPADLLLESLDPTEQLLEESEHQEIEIFPKQPAVSEPVVEDAAIVVNEPAAPMHRELQRWEDWKQVEQAAAFAPWKIQSEPLDYESPEEIELAQPIDEVIPPSPTAPEIPETSEVPPHIFMNSTRTRNIAIGIGVAIFFVQILLFMNWPLNSRKTAQQTKVVQTPIKETKPPAPAPAPAPKPEPVKPQPKVEVAKKEIAQPVSQKQKPKVVAATRAVATEPSKKQAKIKYESKKSEPAPAPLEASVTPTPVNNEKAAKARELNNQGSDLLRAGKVSEGISLLEQAVHTFPKNTNDASYASALLNLGRAWRMAGRPDISIKLLQQRMKINIERDEVARELMVAKRQAVESGMGIKND
jgi:outer membrane biosynthesis protein TonB